MKIKEFSDIRTGHAFRERLLEQPEGNVSVIQPKDIHTDGTVTFSAGKPLRAKVSSPKHLKKNDLLVVNRGRFAAAVFNFPAEANWIVTSSILVLSVRDESVLPEYIALYINSNEGQRLFRQHLEYSTIPFISTNNMAGMEIPVPSLVRQKALIEFRKITRKYESLTNRKQKLYMRILSHELVDQKVSARRRK